MPCPNCKCSDCKPKQPEEMSWVAKHKCEAYRCENQASKLSYYRYYYGSYGDWAEGHKLLCEEHTVDD